MATSQPFDVAFASLAEQVVASYEIPDLAFKSAPVPPRLPEIIRTCFFASLRMEEKHSTQFRVICAPPEIIQFTSDGDWDWAPLVDKKPLTPHLLSKLSAGLQPPSGAIVVWPNDSGPMVLGVARILNRSSSDRPHTTWGGPRRLALSILATGPGMLSFDNLEGLIGEFGDGDFYRSIPLRYFLQLAERITAMSEMSLMAASNLEPLVMTKEEADKWFFSEQQQQPNEVYLPKSRRYRARSDWQEIYWFIVRSLLHHMQVHGRGGTLILTDSPDRSLQDNGIRFEYEYRLDAPLNRLGTLQKFINEYFRCVVDNNPARIMDEKHELMTRAKQIDPGDDCKSAIEFVANQNQFLAVRMRSSIGRLHAAFAELMRAIRFVTGLTAADGATIVSPTFGVYTMAAKLRSNEHETSIRHLTGTSWNRRIQDLPLYDKKRGTRFSSAVSYASTNKQSIVFVASVDGPISVIASVDGEVVVAEPLSFQE